MSFRGEYSGARIESAKVYVITKDKHPKLFRLAEGILKGSAVEDSRLKKLVENIGLEFPIEKVASGHCRYKESFNQNNRGGKNSVWLRREETDQIGLYFLEGENLCSPYLVDVSLESGDSRIATTCLLNKSLEKIDKKTQS